VGRRPRDAEATRQQILDAAESLFAAQGVGSTSLAMIARASDTHKSLILHHFESKDGLWQAVKERRFAGFVEEQKAVFSRGAVKQDELLRAMSAYFELLRSSPVLVQLLTRAQLEKDLSCSQYDEARLEPFVERMREAQKAEILRDDVPPAHLLLILINAITQWFEARAMFGTWSELQAEDPDADFLDSLKKVFFGGAGAGRQAGAEE
jgi:TetR/AcrR family transcriptional regulator